jgi:hypothetical protein
MTITIVEPDEQYVPIGDVLWGAAADWAAPRDIDEPDPMRVAGLTLNVLNGKEAEEHQVIPLGIANPNTISAVGAFGIDHMWFLKAGHKDPYTRYRVYGIVPVALLTDDPKKYEESVQQSPLVPFPDLVLDAKWHKEMQKDQLLDIGDIAELLMGTGFKEGCLLDVGVIAKCLMGSGYSGGCNHLDGSRQRNFAKLKLSNGDWLYVAFWEWYNK